jgi:hypothetical protein
MKIVVFDLDETLGYFTELGIFWDCLKKYLIIENINKSVTQLDFNNILDLYPEFLRPNIINILTYLKNKKNSKCCHKMMIYTNNQGPKEWAHHIIEYFEEKLNYKLFDQIIAAFKVNGKRVEICRTTHDKSHKDFIKCTKLPMNAEICFLDDVIHPEMINDNIYYINLKPYYYDLEFNEMILKFKNSIVGKKIIVNEDSFKTIMLNEFKKYNYNCLDKNATEYEVDKVLGKQIMTHLYEFFNKSLKNKTRKNLIRKNKTKRKY